MDTSNFKLYKGSWVCREDPHKSDIISNEFADILLGRGGYFVRNTYNWDIKTPSSFWFIIKDHYGGIDELPTKVRNQVRKSQKCYDFKMVTPEIMTSMGFSLYNKTRERFSERTNSISLQNWQNWVSIEGLDLWLAIDKKTGEPQAFAINRSHSDYCDYQTMGVNPYAPKSTYPLYGLIMEMNRYYLAELKLAYVLDGARSITGHSNIQTVLEEKFKFRKAYCDVQVFYKSWLGVAVKLLYPVRHLIKNKKISALLNQEAMARGRM